MTGFGPTRTSRDVRSMSAKGCKPDLLCSSRAFPVLIDTVEKVADEVGKSLNLGF